MAAMPATRDQPHERYLLRPVSFILFALLVRGGALAAQYEKLSADPDGYRALAGNLVWQGVLGRDQHPTAYRPPLYPLVLTACLAGPCQPQTAIAILHLALGLATVWLTYGLGRRWQLGGFAYLAGILVACDPILLHQASLVMTETLATFLAVVSLALASAAATSNGRRRLVFGALTSLSFALAALCRPTFLVSLFFFAAALTWMLPSWRQRLQAMVVMGVAALLVLLPWAARNVAVFGKPIISTTHGGYTFLLGNNDDYYSFLRKASGRSVWRADRLDATLRAARSDGEVADDRRLYELAWQTIRRQPGMFLYASLRRVCALWSLLPHQISLDESPSSSALRCATAGWYVIVFGLALAAIGCGAVRTTKPPWLWAMMLASSFTAVHVLYWTDMRMRAPLVPAIALVAAAGALRLYSSRLFRRTSN